MKLSPIVALLILPLGYLLGNTYLVPSTKTLVEKSDLVAIGTIESIKKTRDTNHKEDQLAKKEITISIISILKGNTELKRITVSHTYDDTDWGALRTTYDAIKEELEGFELTLAKKREESSDFTGGKEGRRLEDDIKKRQGQLQGLIRKMERAGRSRSDIPDTWRPEPDIEFLIFLEQDEELKYTIPEGQRSFRRLSYLNRFPQHTYKR